MGTTHPGTHVGDTSPLRLSYLGLQAAVETVQQPPGRTPQPGTAIDHVIYDSVTDSAADEDLKDTYSS